jgi:hypothetical protein
MGVAAEDVEQLVYAAVQGIDLGLEGECKVAQEEHAGVGCFTVRQQTLGGVQRVAHLLCTRANRAQHKDEMC